MQVKKALIYSASILALMGVASETSTVQANPAGFAGELYVALSGNQQKTKAKFSSSAISSLINQVISLTVQTRNIGASLTPPARVRAVLLSDVVNNIIHFSNVLAIIDRDNSGTSITEVDAMNNYNKRLSSIIWTSERSMTLGVKVAAAAGFKIERFSFKLGGFINAPIMNKKGNVVVAKSTTSNNSNTNSNANTNASSSSNSKVSLNIVEEKSMSFGGMGIFEYSISDKVTVGSEFGFMRLKNSYDLSNPNKDLLGIDGIPTGVDAKGKNKQDDVFDRSDEYKTYNKVEGAGWGPYFALRLTYNFNKCFGLMLTVGYRGGTELKLTSNGKEIKNPDYNIKVEPGFCGSFGLKLTI